VNFYLSSPNVFADKKRRGGCLINIHRQMHKTWGTVTVRYFQTKGLKSQELQIYAFEVEREKD
jgi:hypothetical protein